MPDESDFRNYKTAEEFSKTVEGTRYLHSLYLKAVNPAEHSVNIELNIAGGFTPKIAELKIVAPDSLQARNTLDKPDAIGINTGKIKQDSNKLHFELPRWSAGVVIIM